MTSGQIAGRLLLSAFFGTLVGIERQWRHKNAGLKTCALVSIGATSFGLIALGTFGPGGNPTQIAAGVVTGIGFIGAGVVMHRGASVQGINSAATLWATASMGLAIGQGSYPLATSVLGTVLLVQISLQWAIDYINKRSGLKGPMVSYRLSLGFNSGSAEDVRQAWTSFVSERAISVMSYGETQKDQGEVVVLDASFSLPEDHANEAASLGQAFSRIPGVTQVNLTQIPVPD